MFTAQNQNDKEIAGDDVDRVAYDLNELPISLLHFFSR